MKQIGIIGCGAVAQTLYARTLPRSAGVRVAYVHDVNDAAARTLAAQFGARVAGLEEICRSVDAVIIATPPSTHFQLVQAALAGAAVVVCEKPFVATVAQAETLVATATKLGRLLYVGHLRRTFDAVAMVRSVVSSGALGRVRSLDVAEGGRFSWDAASEYLTSDPFGGVLFDTGSHAIDMALHASGLDEGPVAPVVKWVRRDRPEPSHEVDALLDLETVDGPVELRVRLSRYEALANRVRIGCDAGTLDLSVGLRSAVRLTGPSGSTVIRGQSRHENLEDAMTEQWRMIFGGRGAETFEARRFVGLTGILESLHSPTPKEPR